MLCFALERRPVDVVRVAVGWNLAEPAPVGLVAKVVRLDGRDDTQAAGPGQLADLLNALSAVHLHADLNHASRTRQRVPHTAGVGGIERHGLLLIHVLARLDRGDEVERVQVLRRRDQDRVDRLVVQERPVVLERRDAGDDCPGFLEPAGVDVRHRNGFDIGAPQGGPEDLLAARAATDQADPDSFVRPQDATRRGSPGCRHDSAGRPPIIGPRKARRWDMACLRNGGECSIGKRP
jgi:hypothetical protein